MALYVQLKTKVAEQIRTLEVLCQVWTVITNYATESDQIQGEFKVVHQKIKFNIHKNII